jgi:hypothetical protein
VESVSVLLYSIYFTLDLLVGILHYRMILGDQRHFKQYTFQLYHTGPLLLVQEPENNHHINMVQVANKQYKLTRGILWGLCCSFFIILRSVLWIIVCPFSYAH